MHMINEVNEELKDILRYNDAMREEERVRITQDYIEILSDSSPSLF